MPYAHLWAPLVRRHAAKAYGTGPTARLPVLMYHRVLPDLDPLQPDMLYARQADHQFELIGQIFDVLPLDEAVALMRAGRLPERALCITFDDGYRDNHDIAVPLLRRHGLTATFFVASGLLDGGRMFHDTVLESVRRMPPGPIRLEAYGAPALEIGDRDSRRQAFLQLTRAIKRLEPERRAEACAQLAHQAASALPDDLMMTPEQVRAMARCGMGIGGHTLHHPILTRIDDARARQEIVEDRARLADLLGHAPTCFAYPNGKPRQDYLRQHVEMVREAGYETAVSTAFGVCDASSDRLQLPRFVVNERSQSLLFLRLLRTAAHLGRDRST